MNTDILQVALSQYGLHEVAGAGDNPAIINMAKACGFPDYIHDSEAWCSLAMNYWALRAGYEASKSLAARSWLKVGTPIDTPEIGDVVVLWRDSPDSAFGHVTLWINDAGTDFYGLGGNQGDMVDIAAFPKTRILGYRRLKAVYP